VPARLHEIHVMPELLQVPRVDGPEVHDAEEILKSILDNPQLPTPPALALRIVDTASRPNCELKELLPLLRNDPSLCGRLLKTVNSSMFGLPHPVGSLEKAVLVLGLKPLRSLVLGLSLSALQSKTCDQHAWKYWQESMAGAVIARELAVRLRRPSPEDDLMAGLLRDLGILALQQLFPEDYHALRGRDPERLDLAGWKMEKETLGVHHAEVSAEMLQSWRLPPDIVEPVRYHHEPELLTGDTVWTERAWLLNLAGQLAQMDVLGRHPDALKRVLQLAEQRFGLNQDALGAFLKQVTPKISEFAAVLQVDIGTCANYAAIFAAGCEAMVKLSIESSRASHPRPAPRLTTPAPAKASAAGLQETNACVRADAHAPRPLGASAVAADTLADFDISCLSDFRRPFRLGDFEVRERLGRGGMGVVFKAFDPKLARFVAIKMLTPEMVVSSESRARFEREARTVAGIQHENVVTVYTIGEVNCLPYLVMEYVAGMSLQDYLDQHGPVPIDDVIRFGIHIASGLDAAHLRRVIHRDVKPANVLLESRKRVAKLMDFGLARILDDAALSRAGMWVGTPLYMAPEQFRCEPVDARTDLFALGSVLYTLCAGKTPFMGDSVIQVMREVCDKKPMTLRLQRRDAPAWLEELISRLQSKDPKLRPSSAAEVVKLLERQACAKPTRP
jgi:HD-like signal output (HDOD) protein/predicted Ser/Thr protein kinase